MSKEKKDALNVMISGAPASGKGTQCHLITNKVSNLTLFIQINTTLFSFIPFDSIQFNSIEMQYDLVHIAAGDLLRAEIATGSENGKRAKQYMEKGQLVPDEIVVMVAIYLSTII